MSFYPDPIDRFSGHSPDFDAFRKEAVALRRSAMQRSSMFGKAMRLLVPAALIAGALLLAPSSGDRAAACEVCKPALATASQDRTGRISGWHQEPMEPSLY